MTYRTQKLVSIVLVNYNQGEYLEQAILSILTQSFVDYELIVIDGASTDNSVDVLKKYEKQIKFWVSEADNGQSHAFNKGFAKAEGEYFFWVNADDVLLPNALQIIADAIAKYPAHKWFVGNTLFFDAEGKILKCRRAPDWSNMLIKNGAIYVAGPSSIFHRSLYEKVGNFDQSLEYTMDTDLWMRFIRAGYTFKRIRDYIWGFRLHEGSKTSHSFRAMSDEMREEEKYIQLKITIRIPN